MHSVFELKALTPEDITLLLIRAAQDGERGMGAFGALLDRDAAEFLADAANGDARAALNALELGVLTTGRDADPYPADRKKSRSQACPP